MRTQSWPRPFDDDHDAFRESVRRFFADEVVPGLDGWRRAGGGPLDVWVSAAKHGLLGTGIDEQYGGGGVNDPLFAAVLVEEAMAVGAVGTAWLLAAQEGIALPLLREEGSPEQQDRWLAPVMTGRAVVPLPFGVVLSAEAVADGLRLTGRAQGVVGIDGPMTFLVRFREDDGDADGGIAVLAADAAGLNVTHVTDALGGLDATQLDMTLDGAVVGSSDVIRPSPKALEAWRADCHLWAAVAATAGADAVLDLTLEYVAGRKVFDRPLAAFENTRHRLAEVAAHLTQARIVVDRLLKARAKEVPDPVLSALARLSASVAHDEAVDRGLQLHGGYGYMREYPISSAFADARFLRQQEQLAGDARDDVATGLGLPAN